jgi:aldehyde:ferredoxin oxidoreductase
MEPRMPIQQVHEIGLVMAKWSAGTRGLTLINSDVIRTVARQVWGGELAAAFTPWVGKALAVKMIQDREFAEASLILCNFLWPITDCDPSPDKVGDPGLESRILAAVLGNSITEEELYKIGERIFNLQRAILVREGHRGRQLDTLPDHFFNLPVKYDQANADCVVPGKGGEVVSRKGAVVDRDEFEKMKDEYYRLRGWNSATGLQTRETLEKVGLPDVAGDLHRRGLLA